jgi:hypothetical protein
MTKISISEDYNKIIHNCIYVNENLDILPILKDVVKASNILDAEKLNFPNSLVDMT